MAIPPAVAKVPTRIPWAELLERVFRIDVLRCERCDGRMTVRTFLTERASVKKVLEHLGLPTTGVVSLLLGRRAARTRCLRIRLSGRTVEAGIEVGWPGGFSRAMLGGRLCFHI